VSVWLARLGAAVPPPDPPVAAGAVCTPAAVTAGVGLAAGPGEHAATRRPTTTIAESDVDARTVRW